MKWNKSRKFIEQYRSLTSCCVIKQQNSVAKNQINEMKSDILPIILCPSFWQLPEEIFFSPETVAWLCFENRNRLVAQFFLYSCSVNYIWEHELDCLDCLKLMKIFFNFVKVSFGGVFLGKSNPRLDFLLSVASALKLITIKRRREIYKFWL